MMPAPIAELDAAIHRQPVDPERHEKQMQKRGVIGVTHVLHIELPVVRHGLGISPKDPHAAAQDALDIIRHLRADMLPERLRFIGKGAEDQPVKCIDAEPLQTVTRGVEILWHAALAADALGEGDAREVALQIERPVVIDAGQPAFLRPTRLARAHQIAAMGAAVDQRVDPAFEIAQHDHRRLADIDGPVVAGLGNFLFHAEETPDRTAKYALLLDVIDFGVGVHLIGHAADPFLRPCQMFAGVDHSFSDHYLRGGADYSGCAGHDPMASEIPNAPIVAGLCGCRGRVACVDFARP